MDPENVKQAKAAQRAEMSARRKALGADERAAMDAAIAANVRALPEWEHARLVLPYLSFGTEVDTRELIADAWAAGKRVALPRCIPGTREMAWYLVNSLDNLETSSFGVDEPPEDPARAVDPCAEGIREHTLVLVPGFSFDAAGYRLGYGGGFYDTFLARYDGVAAGLCRACFYDAVTLEHGAYDLPVRLVVTDAGVIRG